MGLIGEALMGCCRMDTEVWMLTVDADCGCRSAIAITEPHGFRQ